MKRVLVGTLYSGENELEQCIRSVENQINVYVEHIVIENLPKQEAHQKLYGIFNSRRTDFDYFAKLDADMRFTAPDSLVTLISSIGEETDILSVTVHDKITDTDMQSFNIFTNRCRFFESENDKLFTDRVRMSYAGNHVFRVDPQRNIEHAFDPTPYQAFAFGVHRALKVMQYGTDPIKIENSYHQKAILYKAYKHYESSNSHSARQALIGATCVLEGLIRDAHLYDKNDYTHIYFKTRNEGLTISKLLRSASHLCLARTIGLNRYLNGMTDYIIRKVVK